MIVDDVRERMVAAMRAKDAPTRDILRVALGELQTAEARQAALTDEQAAQVIRKLVKSNQETIELTADPAAKARLARENAVLADLLPKGVGVEEIVAALAPVAAKIVSAGNDGQATGMAITHLRAAGVTAQGADVAAAVQRMRTAK